MHKCTSRKTQNCININQELHQPQNAKTTSAAIVELHQPQTQNGNGRRRKNGNQSQKQKNGSSRKRKTETAANAKNFTSRKRKTEIVVSQNTSSQPSKLRKVKTPHFVNTSLLKKTHVFSGQTTGDNQLASAKNTEISGSS